MEDEKDLKKSMGSNHIYFFPEDEEGEEESREYYEAIKSLPIESRRLGDKEFLETFEGEFKRLEHIRKSVEEAKKIKEALKQSREETEFVDLSELEEVTNRQIAHEKKLKKLEYQKISNDPYVLGIIPKSALHYLDFICESLNILGPRREQDLFEEYEIFVGEQDLLNKDEVFIRFNACNPINKVRLARMMFDFCKQNKGKDYATLGQIFYEETMHEIAIKDPFILAEDIIPNGVNLVIGAIICELTGISYLKRDNENLEYAPWSGIEICIEDKENKEEIASKIKNIYSWLGEDFLEEENVGQLRDLIVKEVRTNQKSLDNYGDSYLFDEIAFIGKYFEIKDEDKLDLGLEKEELTEKIKEFIECKLKLIKGEEDENRTTKIQTS